MRTIERTGQFARFAEWNQLRSEGSETSSRATLRSTSKRFGCKAQKGQEPNDRGHDRELERKLRPNCRRSHCWASGAIK